MQSKKDIIYQYLNTEGNNEKSVRVSIKEILEQFSVNISTGMFQKTKKEWSEHPVNSEQSEHPVNSEQSEHPVNRVNTQ